MATYKLIKQFEDGTEEESGYDAPLGSGIEVGRPIKSDGRDWKITEVIPGDPPTLILEPQQ